MLYDRKIKYLDYIVGGERLQAAGFVKAEVRDEVCRMQIHVNGLHLSDSFERKITLRGADSESFLKMIKIEGGKGDTGELVLNTSGMGSGGISYGGLEEIIIPIDNEKQIRCIWNAKAKEQEKSDSDEYKLLTAYSEDKADYSKDKADYSKNQKDYSEDKAECSKNETDHSEYKTECSENEKDYSEGKTDHNEDKIKCSEIETDHSEDKTDYEEPKEEGKLTAVDEDMHATRMTPDAIEQPRAMTQYPQDDKWRQLATLYEHGNVLGDMSDCILIRPGDFVILPDKYYKLVNNSFLLHGYHNYGYMVLARTEKRGEIKYYIGVPGNFFEKEKQVAIMFGFESFECGKAYIQPGDFGYYMIRVEL